MITKTSATITNLKNLFIEMFLDKTAKVSNVADGSVVNATAFGVAKVAQKAMKDIAIKEAQIFPDTATGVYLDKAAALYGVSPRKGALGSSTYIRVSADPGTVYDTTVTFVSKNGIRFQVDESLTVGESGYGYVKVRSVNAGYTTNVAPNSITNVNPQPQGHIECTNEYYAIGGRDSEDDETFRIRIKNNLNVLSKNTVEYWTQVLNGIDDRVLKVMAAGLNEQGIYNLYIVSQNGIFFTEDELGTLLEQVQGYFSLSDLNIEGKAVGISLKNIDWFYVGSERGLDFRVQLQPDYDVATVRQNIQVNLTKYLDFRFWTPGDVVEWDDLLDIVKKTEGVKYVPDEYFFPYYDQQVPANQLPRIRGFIMRDQDGNILYDSDSNLSPLFYPAESEDLFVGINDSSLNLYQTAFFNVKDSDGNPVEGVNISIGNNGISTNEQGQASLQLANGQYSYIASLQGYIPVEGTFVVLNGGVSIDVEMVRAPYTVTFRVRDERGAAVPYANVTMDNRTTTTNIEGVATLSARNGNYPYLISKLGYDDYSNNVVVQDGNAQVNVEMEFTVWTITVIVKDAENDPIANAVVKVNNGQYPTNQQGEVEIPLVNGQYPVTIEKTGYDTLNGSITVNNSNADVTFELDYFLYDVLFNVYQVNQGTPAEGALVTIQGQPSALPVNSLGQATTKLKNGEYNYTITKRGYDDLTGSFNVQGQNVNIERTLDLKHYNVVITVLDSDSNEPVQGAAVNINSSSYPTNDKGQVTVSLQNGTYPYTVTKSGYYDGNSSVTVLDSDNSSVVNLQARLYNVILSVRDPERQPIENATVTINNNTYQTQSNGQVSLQLKNGTYPFTITATGMDDYSDDLTVASADIPLVTVDMEYRKYNITFAVTTDEGVAVGNANLHVNDNDYQTSQGGLVTVPLSNGTYSYIVTKAGYVQQEGSVTVANADKNVAVTVTAMSYDVTFVVKDNMASPNLLQDVEIQISGREDALTTNASGEATVSLKAGSYIATFAKGGYKGEELSLEVSGEETFTQILKKIWNLSFKVSAAEKTVLQGVTINVSGEALVDGSTILTTKEDGTTDPVQVVNGAYDWNASLTGYSPEEGVGSINDADEIKEVELTYGFETTFTVKDNLGSPVDGVQIVIDGSETLTTANGGIAATNLSTGTHTYTYSKDGYVGGSGTVQIEEAEKSVDITINAGAVVTFHTTAKSGNLANVKIVISQATKAGKAKVRALPETIVTNQQGIATISLPSGNYVYSIPTSETDNTDLIDVPDGTFQVGTEVKTLELDLSDYLKYTIKFQTIPSVSGVNITLKRENVQVDTGSTNDSGVVEFQNRNGNYTYTATKTGYVDLSGSFSVNDGAQTVTLNMQQVSTVTFTVKKEIDSSPIQNAVVEMVDRLDPSNKYKGTTGTNGVATMNFAGGDFEWSQDDDADYSGTFVLPENETYTIPEAGVPGDQMKTYFPNGVVFSPITEYNAGSSSNMNAANVLNRNRIDGWNGSWDAKKRNFTLTGVKKEEGTTVTNDYVVFNVDAGFVFNILSIIMIGPIVDINYNKPLDFGVKVSGVPENLKIVANWGSVESPNTLPLTNDTIQRIQLSDLIFDAEELFKSTAFSLNLASADEGSLSTDDIKSLNITISFYGKKFTSTEVPENKVLYGNYNYTMTPPSPYEAQSGVLNVNTPAINKELLVSNNTEVTFKVTEQKEIPFVFRPKVGDFVYGDKTWSTELDSSKTCVGVITDVRSRDFDFMALNNLVEAPWSTTAEIIAGAFVNPLWRVALIDFSGKTNTEAIVSFQSSANDIAAGKCNNYSTEGFGVGSWYLPSTGQWKVAYYNKSVITAAMNKTAGSPIQEDDYWTSSQNGAANAYYFAWDSNAVGTVGKISNSYPSRPFCTYEYNPIPNGVYICDYSGNRYTTEEWVSSGKSSSEAIGVGVATDNAAFMISSTYLQNTQTWGSDTDLDSPFDGPNFIAYLPQLFHGKAYTDYMVSLLDSSSAARYCKDVVAPGFPKGSGYLPSTGEADVLHDNLSAVNTALELIDATAAIPASKMWTSIVEGTDSAYYSNVEAGTREVQIRNTAGNVLPFFPFPFKGGMEEGVYILGKNNKLYEKDQYSSTIDDTVGVAVMVSGSQFVISKAANFANIEWANSGGLIDGIVTTTARSIAMEDFAGESNTDKLVEQLGSNAPAAYSCRTTTDLFPEGYTGYLPSLGELTLAYYYKDQIEACMTKIGGRTVFGTFRLWSSTQRDENNAWTMAANTGGAIYDTKASQRYARAFARVRNIISTPIFGALVKMTSIAGTVTGTTNDEGEAVLSVELNQSYNYEVSADTYLTATGNAGTVTEAKTIEVALQPGNELNITIHKNNLFGDIISGVQVVVSDQTTEQVYATGTTPASGALILYLPTGTFKITVQKDGYVSKEGTVTISEGDGNKYEVYMEEIFSYFEVQIKRAGSISGYVPSEIQPRNPGETIALQTASTSTGTATFNNVTYGTYDLYMPEGDYSKEITQRINVTSNGMQVQLNVTPLYYVHIKVLPAGGQITLVDSDGKSHQGSAVPATYTASIPKVPAGNYSITITSEGYDTFTTNGVFDVIFGQSFSLEYTLTKPNKLVQITSDQKNYILDTSYKYISLLLVGRGGVGKNTDNAPNAPQWIGGCMGGDGGMIAYKKNIITSSDGVGGIGWITQIDFRHSMSGSSSPGLYVRYNQSLGNEITAFLGDMSNGQDHRQDYWEFALNGETDSGLFVYGRTEGGLATSVLTAGSGGSYGNGEQTTSTATTMQGGEGGDGRLGTQGPDYNTGIRASETIPIQSVFGGIGTGGLSYFISTTNCKASGGGGYGEANPNGSAGYGAGGTCFKIGSGTNDYNEGAGIVCIYYHNNPI
jgi:uncharacterized membrane protein/uncharacterized phage protein gp47/JayE|nr:MAG TPA: Baseplate J like protein [Caudoviricetes sp.]